MHNLNRRQFVKGSLAAGAGLFLPARRVLGANDDIHVGFIGLGGRGGGLVKQFSGTAGVRVAGLCDPDSQRVDGLKKKYPQAKASTDLREILDDDHIDVVVVATCNHWHVLASLWACQAGKDVYVEKPISHNIWEGRKLVEAARKYNRIVQGGTQQRSDPLQAEIKAYLDSGAIGQTRYIRANRYGVRGSIGKRDTPLPIPENVNYNLWCGPAPMKPLFREKFHYDWHWMFDTGNGEMGNWGVHILDDVRNVLKDLCKLPRRCLAGGGRFVWNDAGETPNTHFVFFDTGVVPVVFDLHNLPAKAGAKPADRYLGTGSGYVVHCEGGCYTGRRGGGAAYDKNGKEIRKFRGDGGRDHAGNFIKAVRSRKREDLNAEIEEIHYSSAWCHLGNVAYRLGREYSRNRARNAMGGFAPWQDVIDGFPTHLEANGLDLNKTDVKLSPVLEIDSKRETFVGSSATPEALALLRQEYREPFVVPDDV